MTRFPFMGMVLALLLAVVAMAPPVGAQPPVTAVVGRQGDLVAARRNRPCHRRVRQSGPARVHTRSS
jgi:hypothetical protein